MESGLLPAGTQSNEPHGGIDKKSNRLAGNCRGNLGHGVALFNALSVSLMILKELVHDGAEPHWINRLVQQNIAFIPGVT